MAIPLPTFNDLKMNYPVTSSPLVKSNIGGNVNAAYITNTCVVRMSRAFNYVGVNHAILSISTPDWKIAKKPDFLEQRKLNGHEIPMSYNYIKAFETVSGADNKRYCLRVTEFFDYLNHKYRKYNYSVQFKKMELTENADRMREFKKILTRRKGIVCFKLAFQDASGHFTLWDGEKCLKDEYFDDYRLDSAYFWECK